MSFTWLDMGNQDAHALLLRSMSPTWEGRFTVDPSTYQTRAAETQDRAQLGPWERRELRCVRDAPSGFPGGAHVCLNVHWLRISDCGALSTALEALALKKERRNESNERSNVGGFHSDDLSELPVEIADALREMVPSHRDALNTESWLNVSREGNWNHMHTHPGSYLSGVYYASAGPKKTTCTADAIAATEEQGSQRRSQHDEKGLDGQMLLLVSRCGDITEENWSHLESTVSDVADSSSEPFFRFLCVDPEPGTMVIFPSFMPHFVFPASAGQSPRISLAFNLLRAGSRLPPGTAAAAAAAP